LLLHPPGAPMSRLRAMTLRALLIWGMIGIAGTGILGALAALALASHLRDQLEHSTQAVLEEEQIADLIDAGVDRQVLDATRYLQRPDAATLTRFRDEGDRAAADLNLYLFRPLTVAERLQVQNIKDQHEALEVTAGTAFNLALTGDRAEAQRRNQLLYEAAADLQRSVDQLIDMRRADRQRLGERQAANLRQLYLVVIIISALLALSTLLLLRTFQRRLIPRLNALRAAAGALAEGDLEARVAVAGSDELAAVGTSFNRMAVALQAARAELGDRNEELAATIERLRRTQTELIQNEKLSALGGMLAGMAHELNNPLASVLGNAELLSARLHELPEPAMRALAEELADPIAHEALRARELIRNLLHMARQSEMVLGPVSLNAALDVATGLRAYAFAQAGLRLDVDAEPDLWVVADRQRLEQSFLNIINNAYDAMVQGRGSRAAISAWRDGAQVIVLVQDDGPGLPDAARVFDPFYTTKPVGSGTGLGLTIVHRFVEEAGGSIEAVNAPGGGALFRLRLRATTPVSGGGSEEEPAVPHQALVEPMAQPPVPPPAPVTEPAPRPRLRALVVEDEEPIRRLHRRILARLQLEVLVAASGVEGRDILQAGDVDVVISDVKMPGEMNGIALYRWVIENRPALAERFLFVTGDTHDPVLLELLRERPERFITKPFQIQEYLDRLESVLAGVPAPQVT
ncbi:MAG TPA: ATP-binding protein, partial [Longimicrobiales bacterium]